MNIRKIHLSASILSLLANSAIAQETFELDDIVISGGNSPIKAADLATSNSVITSGDIYKQGDVTVQSLLRQIPGVAVSSAGSSFTEVKFVVVKPTIHLYWLTGYRRQVAMAIISFLDYRQPKLNVLR